MQSETHERKGSRVGRLESSTNAARRVMDWFRKRSQRQAPSSKGISPIEASGEIAHTANRVSVRNSRPISSFGASTGPFASEITGSMLKSPTSPLATQTQISETNNETRPYSLARPSLSRPDLHKDTAPIHRGLIDQNTLTTKHPEEIMSILEGVLTGMNISFKHESPFRLRCVHQGQQSSETTGQTVSSIMFHRKGDALRHPSADQRLQGFDYSTISRCDDLQRYSWSPRWSTASKA